MTEPVRLFISYSRESPRQERRVRQLADRLRGDGFEVRLDQYEERFTEALTRWMEREMAAADYVLAVITEAYGRRAAGEEEAGRGQGTAFESHLMIQDLFAASMRNAKYIPVIFADADARFIPGPLRGYRFYRVDTDAGYDALRRNLRERSPLAEASASPAAAPSRGQWHPLGQMVLAVALLVAGGYAAFRLQQLPANRPKEARPAAPAAAGTDLEVEPVPPPTVPAPSPAAAAPGSSAPPPQEKRPLPPVPTATAQLAGPIQASGSGWAPAGVPEARGKALARRAAEIDARRRLAEQVATRIRSQTRVVAGEVVEDEILATVDQVVLGARIVGERELPDGGYEVTLEVVLPEP